MDFDLPQLDAVSLRHWWPESILNGVTTASNSAAAYALSACSDRWGTIEEGFFSAATTRFFASIELEAPRTSVLGSDSATDSSPMIFGLILVGFVYGTICGLIASTIAERKGRSAGGFFLLGLLLGIFAIAVAAVVGPGQPSAPPGMRAVEWRRCSARQNIDDGIAHSAGAWRRGKMGTPHDRGPDAPLTARALDHPDSAQLLRDYAVERRAMVGFGDPPDLDRQPQYDPPSGLFLVAYTAAGEPVACGGIRAYSQAGRVAEIRKMHDPSRGWHLRAPRKRAPRLR